MLSIILCCAALFAVSNALPSGAPVQACDNLIPGASGHGTTEQSGANPWMIDLSDFDFNDTISMYTYNPGGTYNSKLKVRNLQQFPRQSCVTYGSWIHACTKICGNISLP